MATIAVTGLSTIDQALKRLGDAARKAIIRDHFLPAASTVIVNGASQRAPRATGALARGLAFEIADVQGEPVARMGAKRDVFYDRFQELGTRFQPAQPHWRPAIHEDGQKALQRGAQASWHEIVRITKQGQGG